MGWTFPYGATRRQAIAEVTAGWKLEDGSGVGCETLRHCARGNVVYVVMESTRRNGEKYRFIAVHLLQRSEGDWGYKSMDEDMGPYNYNCPVSYIELAEEMPPSEGMGKNANAWRAEVRRRAALRSRKYTVGQIVESVRPLNYGGVEVSRFKIHKLPRGGRSLYCWDADGKFFGLLRLKKEDVAGLEANGRRAAVEHTKDKNGD